MTGKNYSDFDLMIEGTGSRSYRARVLESPAGGAAGSFTLPFSDTDLELFLLKVSRPRRGVRRLESPEMEAARQFGKQLYDAVFQDDLRLSLRRSLDEVERRDEGLRIRLWFTDAPELASLPWEFLYSESEDQFLVLSAWTPIVRYLDLTQRIQPLTVDGPLRILAMISSPHDYPELDVEEEWRRIEGSLRPLKERGAVAVDRVDNATLLELQRQLRRNEYHIFHFLGHGGFDEKADDGVLVMEDGHNRSRLVAGRDLGTILNDHRSLRLAVLNACEGARAADDDPFSGAAQSVIRKGIPAVVAMQFEITDDAAIAFAQEFYGAIADAYPVDAAIGEARRAIFGLGNDIEWGTPVVYLRGDGRLFDVRPATAPPAGAETAVTGTETETTGTEEVESVSVEVDQTEDVDATVTAVAAGIEAEPVEDADAEERVAEPVEDEAPAVAAGTSASLLKAVRALPLWVIGVVVAVVALVVVVLAVVIFSTDEPGEITDTTGTTQAETTETTAAVVTQTTVFAADAEALAQRTAVPKVIDGNDDDWTEGIYHTTDHVIYYAPPIQEDPGARAGEENESLIRLAWDDTYLYVFAEVIDDILAAPENGDQIWQNDAVNLNISVIGPDGSISESVDDDDHQLTLSPGDPVEGDNEESAHYVIGGRALSLDFADVVSGSRSGPGYVLEARLPWSEIAVSAPQPGDRFGLLLTVFDNDDDFSQAEIKANTPPGEGPLDNRWFRSPQTWGSLTLEG